MTTTRIARFDHTAFILDESKLTRLIDVAQGRTEDIDCQWTTEYRVRLKNGKHFMLGHQEEVLALDNTVMNPITHLSIEFIGRDDEDKVIANCEAEFERASFGPAISVISRAKDPKWAQYVQAELEEQVDRTKQTGLITRIGEMPTRILIPLLALAVLVPLTLIPQLFSQDFVLDPGTKNALLERGGAVTSDSARMAFLVESQLAVISSLPTGGLERWDWLLSWQTWFLAVPLLLAAVLAGYAVIKCYPPGVFLWGDMKEHYESLVSRRRTIWTVCVLALVVGVLGNLAAASILILLR